MAGQRTPSPGLTTAHLCCPVARRYEDWAVDDADTDSVLALLASAEHARGSAARTGVCVLHPVLFHRHHPLTPQQQAQLCALGFLAYMCMCVCRCRRDCRYQASYCDCIPGAHP